MSNAPKLYKAIMADEATRVAVLNAADKGVRQQAVLEAGERFDLPVTLSEARDFLNSTTVELSDEDLEMVVGGKSNPSDKDAAKALL